NVRLLTDEEATAPNILGAVDSFLKPNVKPGDQVVIFLAGHGVAKGVGLEARSFFLSADVKGLTTATLEATAVDLKALSHELSEPVVLMRVQRPLPTATIAAVPPTLTVVTQPAGAQVTLDGERIGAAPVMKPLPKGGHYTLRVETPGCAPVERSITAIEGYG